MEFDVLPAHARAAFAEDCEPALIGNLATEQRLFEEPLLGREVADERRFAVFCECSPHVRRQDVELISQMPRWRNDVANGSATQPRTQLAGQPMPQDAVDAELSQEILIHALLIGDRRRPLSVTPTCVNTGP